MAEDTDWIEETFEGRLDDVEDLTLEDIEEWYEEKLEKYSGHESAARAAVQGQYNEFVNTGADGEVRMVTIGADGPRPFGDSDMLFGFVLAIPEDDPARLGVVMFDEKDVNHDEILPYFREPYQPVKGELNIRSAGKVSDAYVLEAVQGTELETFEAEKDREERKEMVDDFVQEAKIADVGQHLSVTNDEGYPADYGVDLRKIPEAFVLEARIGDNGARYEVQDDSFLDARDLDDHIRGDDNARGLVCWVDSAIADFGEGSLVDLYGVITAGGDTGQVTMNVVGVDYDEENVEEVSTDDGEEEVREGGSTSEESAPSVSEERTI